MSLHRLLFFLLLARSPDSTGADSACEDFPAPFPFAVWLGLGTECVALINSFMFQAGPVAACSESLADITFRAATWLGIEWAPPQPFEVEDRLRELCPMTCSAQGVQATRCWAAPPEPSAPPAPPARPLPPFIPPAPPHIPGPGGFEIVTTAAQIRAAITATLPGGSLALYLPPGSVVLLGGAPITVGPISLVMMSDSEGATLDAEYRTKLFDVQGGAQLQLHALTLMNGFSSTVGGTMAIR